MSGLLPDLRDVEVLLTLAEELSFSRTAERVGLTTSRVSQRVARLESIVGAALFIRSSRSVTITPLGEQLAADLAPALSRLQESILRARTVACDITATLRIAVHAPMDIGPHLSEAVRTFEQIHRSCRVEFVSIDERHRDVGALHRGDADLLVARLPLSDETLVTGPVLAREPRSVLILARTHPLAARASASYDDLADFAVPINPAYRSEVNEAHFPAMTPAGRPVRRVEARTMAETLMLIARGEAVVPAVASFADHHCYPEITTIGFDGLPDSETVLVWTRGGETPSMRAFIDCVAHATRSTGDAGRPAGRDSHPTSRESGRGSQNVSS